MYSFKFNHNTHQAARPAPSGRAGGPGFTAWPYWPHSLPPFPSRPSVPAASIINKIQEDTKKARQKILAKDSFLPLVYGMADLEGKLAYATSDTSFLYVLYLFCIGEIGGFDSIYLSSTEVHEAEKGLVAKGGDYHTYLGTADQEPDPWFESLVSGYADALPGVAYAVLKLPASYTSVPACRAVLQGKKVWNPKTSAWEYSANPALWLADFITNADDKYGMGAQVDWDSVIAVQDACDEAMSNGEPRRGGGFVEIGSPQRGPEVIELLRLMAGCFVTREDFVYKLIPDRPADVEASFDMGNMVLEELKKLRAPDTPTVVEVIWTDTSVYPWRTKPVRVPRPEVETGNMPWIPSTVNLAGITSGSWAKRETTERLNKYINDLAIRFTAFDEALKLQAGSVIEVSHDIGLVNKKFRLTREPVLVSAGRWRIEAHEYDPAVYSNEVITQPTYADTNLPDPLTAPDVEGLELDEALGQRADGTVYCRITASWQAAVWPYLEGYEVKIVSGADLIFQGKVGSGATSFASPPVEEKRLYNLSVRAYSSITKGEWTTDSITPVGRWWKPADVRGFYGFESGGVVHLWWDKPNDLDIKAYEIRYYSTAETWDNGLVLNRLNALRYETREIPEGTWKIGIKAVDSLDQFSENVAEIELEVTTDADAFKLENKAMEVDEEKTDWTRMVLAVTDADKAIVGWQEKYFTKADVPWGTMFDQPMGTYDQPLGYYFDNAGQTKFKTLERDYGKDYGGNFLLQRQITALRGSVTEELLLRKDGEATPTSYAVMSVNAKARYEAYQAATSGRGNAAVIRLPVRSQLSVVPRTEYSTSPLTSSATGPTTITLQGSYTTAIDINVRILGDESCDWTYNNLDLDAGTFEVNIFDKDGNRVEKQFNWTFQGV